MPPRITETLPCTVRILRGATLFGGMVGADLGVGRRRNQPLRTLNVAGGFARIPTIPGICVSRSTVACNMSATVRLGGWRITEYPEALLRRLL
jgi:hypothetical protein